MKLICFDVDGTLVDSQNHVWGILNREYNFQSQDDILFERYKKGEITYQEWVNEDLKHYISKGLNRKKLSELLTKNSLLFPGVKETLEAIRSNNNINVVSDSIDFLLTVHEINEFFNQTLINRIIFNGNKIIRIKTTEYGMDKKIEGLIYLSELTGISVNDSAYIGDGDNDISLSKFMRENGGTFIAFNSKSEELRENARYVVDSGDMRDVLRYII